MPDKDIDDLAQRFLDVWQEHVTRLSTDPQLAEAMSRLFTSMALPGAGIPGFAGPQPGQPGKTPWGTPADKTAGAAWQGQANPFGAGFAQHLPPMPAPPPKGATADPVAWAEWMREWMTGGLGADQDNGNGNGGSEVGRDDEEPRPGGSAARQDRTASADASSLDGGELLDRLVGRIAELEQRVAAVEQRHAGSGKNASGSARGGSRRGARAKKDG